MRSPGLLSTVTALPPVRSCSPIQKKWFLGACGFSHEAAGPGEQSFTRSLTEELIKLVHNPFSTTELHRRVEHRLRQGVPVAGYNGREEPKHIPLGEGDKEPNAIRMTSYHAFPINLIAIMGPTGSGKSSFVNTLSGKLGRETKGNLESRTKDADCVYMVLDGVPVTLIDTPGFDDTFLPEAEVLRRISKYLTKISVLQYQKLTGVLYLRDIHEKKVKGSENRNISLFLSLCGEKYLPNVQLVITKWDDESEALDVIEKRERELRCKFWAHMEKLGCGYSKYQNTWESAIGIVKPMLNLAPDYLQIQKELGKGLPVCETAAGRIIDLDQKQKLSELRQRMKEVKKQIAQMEKSHHAALKQALENEHDKIADQLNEMNERNGILEDNYYKLLEQTQNVGTGDLLKKLKERLDKKLPGDITVGSLSAVGAVGGALGLIL